MNPGFDPEEIAQLKKECRAEGMNFIYVEDGFEEDEEENNEQDEDVRAVRRKIYKVEQPTNQA